MRQKMEKSAIIISLFFLVSIVFATTHAFADEGGQLAQAGFPELEQAFQQGGFIQPFQEADNLNYGGLFGPFIPVLNTGAASDMVTYTFFDSPSATPPPNTRDLGFGSDNDRYTPINPVLRLSD